MSAAFFVGDPAPREARRCVADRPAAGSGGQDPLELHRWMCLARAAEERLELLLKQGHLKGSVYRSLGQEAGAVGVASALRRRSDGTGDLIAPTVRDCGALFAFGATLEDFFRQYLGRAAGPTRGRDSDVHWVDWARGFVGPVWPLGTMVGVMAGITMSFRLRGEDRVGAVFYGDGATSTGAWHEGLAFAAARRCPMVLVVENNRWAFSTPTDKTTRLQSFADKAAGYGIGAESVDGTDVTAVREAAGRAVERARSGGGVQLLELRYFRRLGHAQHDPAAYVAPAVLAEWEARDPLDASARRLLESRLAGAEELAEMWREAVAVSAAAADRALAEPEPSGPEALGGVYEELEGVPPWTRSPGPDPRTA